MLSSATILQLLKEGPVRLASNNFTSLARTPWAGQQIARKYKAGLGVPAESKVGESWEFSCDPEHPSRIDDPRFKSELFLPQLLEACPEGVFSSHGPKHSHAAEILVKLVNPSMPLSFQVHPDDHNRSLKPNECGKPESWLVLEAEPGAGFYLGFSHKMSRDVLRKKLHAGQFSREDLQFVPVKANDFFEIMPGVPHAIGPGVTILEPQRVLFGKSGKTYRLWDWERRYNDAGETDQRHGKPRVLQIDEALALIDPETQAGLDFALAQQRRGIVSQPSPQSSVTRFPKNDFYQVFCVDLDPASVLRVHSDVGYAALMMLQGQVGAGRGRSLSFKAGEPALVPFAAWPVEFAAGNERAEFAMVMPANASVTFASPTY